MENKEAKILQYANDTTAVLSDISSAKQLFKLLDSLRTCQVLIGSTKENKGKPFGIKWPNEPIKALGVYYARDVKLLREKNFIERLDSIK